LENSTLEGFAMSDDLTAYLELSRSLLEKQDERLIAKKTLDTALQEYADSPNPERLNHARTLITEMVQRARELAEGYTKLAQLSAEHLEKCEPDKKSQIQMSLQKDQALAARFRTIMRDYQELARGLDTMASRQ
jgi:hypothetical protein